MGFGNKFSGNNGPSAIEVPAAPAPKPMKVRPLKPAPPPPPPPPPPPTEKQKLEALTKKLQAQNEAAGFTVAPEPAKADPRKIEASLRSVLTDYANDPVGFVRDVLGAEPDEWQEDLLRAIAAGTRRISVRAGHGVGKSTVCAWALIWHMVTRFPQKAVVTAPTAGQLFDALFAEIKMWINRLPDPIKSLFDMTSEKVTLRAAPEASFISARTSSADRPEALAGVHSQHVLLICDEASAIPEAVYESAAGSMSGEHACTVLIGNPTRNSGLFFKTHHQLAAEWKTMHVSCLNSRRVTADFVKQISDTYGPDSNAYRVRVLGEFALRDDDTLISAELVDSAMVRDIALDEREPMIYGLDVARFGDDRSVLCKRRGNVAIEFKTWQGLDLMQLTGAIVNEAKIDKPTEICVDSIGLGSGVADRLREVGPTLKLVYAVRDVNVSEASAMNPQAAKLRDELWLSVKEWLNTRSCKLPLMEDLRQELVAPTFTFTSAGKIKVEGKPEMKRRGMRSPDIADALCLTFASMASRVGGRGGGWVPGRPIKRALASVV
jgi:phage terminase large subunit